MPIKRIPVIYKKWVVIEHDDGKDEEIQTENNLTTFAELAQWSEEKLEDENYHSLNFALDPFREFMRTLDSRTDVPEDILTGLWNSFVGLNNL